MDSCGPHLRSVWRRAALRVALGALALFQPPVLSLAQMSPGPASDVPASEERLTKGQEIEQLRKRFLDAFKAKQFDAAEEALLRWIALDGRDFVPYYNMACTAAQQGNVDVGERMLQAAVIRGFGDRVKLVSDPDLEPLRSGETYKAILEGWDRIITASVERRLSDLETKYTKAKGYVYERDEADRLAFVSAFEPGSFKEAKDLLARLTMWWDTQVLPKDEPWRSGQSPSRGGEPWVIVILPTRPDFQAWAQDAYGGMWERIGGEYAHDERRLIAMDLGSTLRHEYWHVLHWRHMERLGQRHPAWIMEGLCSLVEDVEIGPEGQAVFIPSWRTNITKKAARSGGLMPLEALFALDPGTFLRNRPLAQYAHARSLFLFLASKNKLRDWYTLYVENYTQDPTGRVAFEKLFGKPIKEVDKDFRAWLRSLPDTAVEIRPGMANLPFDVDMGSGDGVVVISYPGSRGAGIKMRDIVTAIDGKPVRDLYDVARVLAQYKPGQAVDIAYKRPMAKGEQRPAVASVTLIRQPG